MKTFAIISALAALGLAAPTASSSEIFMILSLRSASPIHFYPGSAGLGRLFLALTSQNATCSNGDDSAGATFELKGDELFLYSTEEPRQQVFVDRSGMGQGIVGYNSDPATNPRNAETHGWARDEDGDLTFDGTSMVACPGSVDDAWSIWLAGVTNPGGNEGCLGFTARGFEPTNATSCVYTE